MEYKNFYSEFIKILLKYFITIILAVYYDYIVIKGIIIAVLLLVYCLIIFKTQPYKN